MGARRVGIADAVDDGHIALIVHVLEQAHGRVQAHATVDGQHLVLFKGDRLTVVMVDAVGVGNDRVHVIVAAGKLKHHQDRVFLVGSHHCLLIAGLSSTGIL